MKSTRALLFLLCITTRGIAEDNGAPYSITSCCWRPHGDHESLANVSALTSSNGRIFYILDEAHTSLIHRPSKWKRDIKRWITGGVSGEVGTTTRTAKVNQAKPVVAIPDTIRT